MTQHGQHIHTVELNLGLLTDAELRWLGLILSVYRERTEVGGPEASPALGDVLHTLLVTWDDERQRRKLEHRDLMDMASGAHQITDVEIPPDLLAELRRDGWLDP